jgi:hypothetical protein
MKSAKTIIQHMMRQPQNSKVIQMACFEKVKSMLPKHLASAVKFIYQKNNTLFFVLNHPGMKMEFHYKHTLIKTLLNKLKEIDANCKDIQITKISSFVTHDLPKKEEVGIKPKRYFREKSKADFTNHAKEEQLHKIFEAIKITILEKK